MRTRNVLVWRGAGSVGAGLLCLLLASTMGGPSVAQTQNPGFVECGNIPSYSAEHMQCMQKAKLTHPCSNLKPGTPEAKQCAAKAQKQRAIVTRRCGPFNADDKDFIKCAQKVVQSMPDN